MQAVKMLLERMMQKYRKVQHNTDANIRKHHEYNTT